MEFGQGTGHFRPPCPGPFQFILSLPLFVIFYSISFYFFFLLVRLKGRKSRSLCLCLPNQKFQTRFILATQKSFIQFANQFYVA